MKPIFFLLAALSGILHAQGPLAPPAGPSPMMKSLDQIEPRTPISSLPYVISESGSYYFTGNLQFSVKSGDAITINASNVTLDLMGFTLSSTSSVVGVGIFVSRDESGVSVRNGFVVGNTRVERSGFPTTWSINQAGFVLGIYDRSDQASFKDLIIRGAKHEGLVTINSTVDNVRVEQCGYGGILADGSNISNSATIGNGRIGIRVLAGSVSNSSALSNGSSGIVAGSGSVVSNSVASGNGATGIFARGGTVVNSVASRNGNDGIFVIDLNYAYGGSVTNSTANRNGGNGICADGGSVTGSTASYNGGDGIVALRGSVSNSTAGLNGIKGISAFGGSVTSCSANENGTNGIYASTGSVTNSTAASNTEPDISASNAVVAYCRFTTFSMSNTVRTGNFPSP